MEAIMYLHYVFRSAGRDTLAVPLPWDMRCEWYSLGPGSPQTHTSHTDKHLLPHDANAQYDGAINYKISLLRNRWSLQKVSWETCVWAIAFCHFCVYIMFYYCKQQYILLKKKNWKF